jgi:hypothetical protein
MLRLTPDSAAVTLATGNGATAAYTNNGSLYLYKPIRPGTFKVKTTLTDATVVVGVNDGLGKISGTGIAAGATINYTTGAVSITFSANVANATAITTEYFYDSEQYEDGIRGVEFDISQVPVVARAHPITFKYSVQSGMVANAHLAIDVQDTLAQLAAQYLKIERDYRLIRAIVNSSTAAATLNFDATMTGITYDRRSRYSELELKVSRAMSIIQTAMGRGSVDRVLAGTNAADILMQARSFQAVPVNAPIGAHVIGTLMDGTVTVIKIPNNNVLDANRIHSATRGTRPGMRR